jgi:glutamine synthetase
LSLNYRPVVATEIEFYLSGSAGRDLGSFWSEVRARCEAERIGIYKIEKETGDEQHEVALQPLGDVAEIIRQTDALKALLAECAKAHEMHADFSAKPKPDQPGSGLHVHVHLEDAHGYNLYEKTNDIMSDALRHSLGGLLATMKRHMPVFAPTLASRLRFVAGGNAPLTLSWGANNRTTALRLPDTGVPQKRIEHRVAGADADVGAVLAAILEGIAFGLAQGCEPGPQMYGDASLPMYGLERLV